jgi:hypothetical protein
MKKELCFWKSNDTSIYCPVVLSTVIHNLSFQYL